MKKTIFCTAMALLALFASCSEEQKPTEGMGTIAVRLTDAPFPYDLVAEANVTIFKVEARLKDPNDTSSKDDPENSSNDSFVVLSEEELNVNLLELTNGTTAMLAEVDVPVGTYDLVRLYVRGVNVQLTDGRIFDLKVPSGEQTGIKVSIEPGITVVGGLSSDLLLDFDVSRSFVAKGNIKRVDGINGFNFKPVIKATNSSTAGTLVGMVNTLVDEQPLPLEGAQISVFAADTLNTASFTDVDGNYTIMGLKAGTYKILAELEGYQPSDTLEVEINVANRTFQDVTLVQNTAQEEETNTGG